MRHINGTTLNVSHLHTLAEATLCHQFTDGAFRHDLQRAVHVNHVIFHAKQLRELVGLSDGTLALPSPDNVLYNLNHNHQMFLAVGLLPNTGLKLSCLVLRCRIHIAPSSASGASSCTRLPRSRANVCSMPTCMSGSSFLRSL